MQRIELLKQNNEMTDTACELLLKKHLADLRILEDQLN